jgi:RNA methyltransferase, TrmH family
MSLPVRSVFYMPRHPECGVCEQWPAQLQRSMPQPPSNSPGEPDPTRAAMGTPGLRHIQSRQNALVKQLRHCFSQAEPAEDGSVAIEGAKLVEEAIRSGRSLRAVFFSESAQERAKGLLALLAAKSRPQPMHAGVPEAILLPDEIFHSAVASESPQGVAALVYPLTAALEDIFRGPHLPSVMKHEPEGAPFLPSVGRSGTAPLILGCAGLQDPGNFGAILRSAEAFGASGVLATEGTVSPANPKVARASAGSIFRLPVVRLSAEKAIAALRKHNVRLAVASSHQGRPAHEIDLTLPTAIFIGNEGQGVPRALANAADELILIPHSSQVESLNAAIAASILLYEAHRQRNR